jgi:DNA-binding CsgD family transcriptional regulator
MFENPEAAFGGVGRLLGLIDLIYAAVEQPALWASVLDGVAEAIHGEAIVMLAPFQEQPLFSMARIPPEALASYVNHYSSINPLAPLCDRAFRDGTTRYSHLVMGDRELEKTEFYHDFFRPNDMYYSMGINVPLGDSPTAYISCMRPKSKGPFEEQPGVVYQTLLPHLQRALSLHRRMIRMTSNIHGLDAALDAFGHAVLGLDREGRVLMVSREAEAMVRSGDGIRVTNGKLSARIAAENARLQSAISQAVTGHFTSGAAHASIPIHRQSNPTPLQLTVVPHRSVLPGRSALAALVFLVDPEQRSASKAELLRTMYDLSPTEARVADLLAEGLTVREIADRLHAALGTAQFHTKRILAKTGVRRQAELMKLMVALPGV